MRFFGRLLGIFALCVALGCGVLFYAYSQLTFSLGELSHCDYEDLGTIKDVAGASFEIKEASCKVPLASTERITVAASRVGRPKVVIFEYDPGSSYLIAPKITQVDQGTILISVGHLSSINYRAVEWEGLAIKYSIGSIDYPDWPKTKK